MHNIENTMSDRHKATGCTYHRLSSPSRLKKQKKTKAIQKGIYVENKKLETFLESRQENGPKVERKKKRTGATGLGQREK